MSKKIAPIFIVKDYSNPEPEPSQVVTIQLQKKAKVGSEYKMIHLSFSSEESCDDKRTPKNSSNRRSSGRISEKAIIIKQEKQKNNLIIGSLLGGAAGAMFGLYLYCNKNDNK